MYMGGDTVTKLVLYKCKIEKIPRDCGSERVEKINACLGKMVSTTVQT